MPIGAQKNSRALHTDTETDTDTFAEKKAGSKVRADPFVC